MLVCLDEDTRRHAILRQIKHKFYICSLASPVNLCFRHNEEALPKKSLINPNSPVSYTHLTLPTTLVKCRSRWSPYH